MVASEADGENVLHSLLVESLEIDSRWNIELPESNVSQSEDREDSSSENGLVRGVNEPSKEANTIVTRIPIEMGRYDKNEQVVYIKVGDVQFANVDHFALDIEFTHGFLEVVGKSSSCAQLGRVDNFHLVVQ